MQALRCQGEDERVGLTVPDVVTGDDRAKLVLHAKMLKDVVNTRFASGGRDSDREAGLGYDIQEFEEAGDGLHVNGLLAKKRFLALSEFVDLVIAKVAKEVAKYFLALAALKNEIKFFVGDIAPDRIKKKSPRSFVDRMAVNDHTVHVKNHRAQTQSSASTINPGHDCWASR